MCLASHLVMNGKALRSNVTVRHEIQADGGPAEAIAHTRVVPAAAEASDNATSGVE